MSQIFIGIREGKVFDVCSDLANRRTILDDKEIPPESVIYLPFKESEYFERDICIDDTWNFEINDSLKDSPERFKEPIKSEIQILQEFVQDLDARVKALETSK